MTKRQTWLDQLNRYIFPVVVVLIGLYGVWDVLVLPLVKVEPTPKLCMTTVTDVAVLKPSSKPNQPPKRIRAPAGLAVVVPAGEQRILSVEVTNPDAKAVTYQWRSTYGQFASPITVENQSTYTAPRALVNDTLDIAATVQGCSTAQKTLTISVVPSANAPLLDQPLPTPTLSPSVPPAP